MVAGSNLEFTADLPAGWENFGFGASKDASDPTAGLSFVVSHVENTFEDPCAPVQRTPKIGSTVEALVTAFREIPHTTATEPVETRVAGFDATYLEVAIPASLPCEPNEFDLWQEGPGAHWWVQQLNETVRIWVIEVDGQRVAIVAHTYPNTSEESMAELAEILDSIVFDDGS